MKNFEEIKEMLTGNKAERTTEGKIITPSVFEKKSLYNMAMSNVQTIGGKQFCTIPLSLLEVDEEYQRLSTINMSKVKDLASHWDENKCDPILVSPHPETNTFAVIDGTHRFLVKGIYKEDMIVASIAIGLSEDPKERQVQEAELFSEQNTHVDHLTPANKHKAYVKRGIRKYCILDECIKGRKLLISPYELKNLPQAQQDALLSDGYRILSGYSDAVAAAALNNGKEILTNILDIIEKSGYNLAPNGYSSKVIRPVKAVLNMHGNDPRIVRAITEYFIKTEPNIFIANALARYPKRKATEGRIIYLEQEVARRIGESPMYYGGDMRKVTSAINVQHAHQANQAKETKAM